MNRGLGFTEHRLVGKFHDISRKSEVSDLCENGAKFVFQTQQRGAAPTLKKERPRSRPHGLAARILDQGANQKPVFAHFTYIRR
jgi:hypothetical protein